MPGGRKRKIPLNTAPEDLWDSDDAFDFDDFNPSSLRDVTSEVGVYNARSRSQPLPRRRVRRTEPLPPLTAAASAGTASSSSSPAAAPAAAVSPGVPSSSLAKCNYKSII